MANKIEKLIEDLKDISYDVKNDLSNKRENEIDNAFYQGYQLCLIKTLNLLVDLNLKDEVIIEQLQKHHDLRLSEAKDMIRTAKNRN